MSRLLLPASPSCYVHAASDGIFETSLGRVPGFLDTMAAWDACTLEPNGLLRWIECHPGVGDYLAAGFTAFATITALLLAVLTLRQERRHRRSAVAVQAHRLYSAITFLAADLQKAKAYLKKATAEDSRSIVAGRLLVQGLPNGIMETLHLLPGNIASGIAQLEQLLAVYDRDARDIFAMSDEAKIQRWAQDLSTTLSLIEETAGDIYVWADKMTSESKPRYRL